MDLVKMRNWFFLLSLVLVVAGVVSLALPHGLRPGIEFTSGSVLNVTFDRPVSEAQVRTVLNDLGHPEARIQKLGDRSVFIRTATLSGEPERDPQGNPTGPSEQQRVLDTLRERVAPFESFQFDSVSPIVARETVRNAAIAVFAATIVILVYITWAFRRVSNPFRYGTTAIIALLHDLLMVLGIYSILGRVFNLEVDAMFIVGLLTVLGYSVHDTIVVFDRIRESLTRGVAGNLPEVVNISLWETMGRSINTTFTTLLVLLALLLMGGPTIRGFLLVLFIGLVSGTYSSIFVASQLLVSWENGDFGKLLRRLHLLPARPASA